MDEYRKTAMISVSNSVSSIPINLQFPNISNDEHLEQLQLQLHSLRNENENLASNCLSLQKTIHQLEDDKISISSNYNKETGALQSLVAHLQTQVERGEAARQSLEYNLALTKKKLNDYMRSTTHKEVTLAKENIQLTDEKASVELKVSEIKSELIAARQLTVDNEKRIALLEDEKRQVLSDKMASEAILHAENQKLSHYVNNLQSENKLLKISIDDSKKLASVQETTEKQLINDLQTSVEREQCLRNEFDELSLRTKSLEECVEAERAAHLESKFNSEIIQLKHEEFQNQLVYEKDTCEKLKLSNEENKARLAELEKQLEFEKHQSITANAKFEKAAQDYANLRKQIDDELSIKNNKLKESSSQVQEYENAVSKFKDELIHVKESHDADIHEIELLLESFCHDFDGAKKSISKHDNKNPEAHSKLVLERLRKYLFNFQKKSAELQNELENQKTNLKELSKDCENFRDLAVSREKNMQQAQQALCQCNDELELIRNQQAEFVREANRASQDLQEVTSELNLQRERCMELEENVNSLKQLHSNELEVHIAFLRELHHVVCNTTGERNTLSRFGWSDLSVTVREAVDVLANNYQRAKEKISQLETSAQEMQHSITELQRAHASSVDRLADRCRERDEEGARQRKQLEQHYEALLGEMNSRTRKTQALCDEAWERIRNKDGLHDGLQAECAQLRGENSSLIQDKKALTCACTLLLGTLYPIFRSRDELAIQCSLLTRIIFDNESSKRKMRCLLSTLNDELSRPDEIAPPLPISFRFIHPLIRFRVAVICVLASNRLHSFIFSNSVMFSCNKTLVSCRRLVVMSGKTEMNSSITAKNDHVKSRSDLAIEWLADSQLVYGVRDATCGLIDAISKNVKDSSGYMPRAIIKTAKAAFLALLEKTQNRFPVFIDESSRAIMREQPSLCRVLADGLDRVISVARVKNSVDLFSLEHSVFALQSHLVSFTERLHAAEVEKRDMRHNEGNLLKTIEQLKEYQCKAEKLNKELKKLKENEKKVVTINKFQGVCTELNSALEREKKAQKLLQEQNSKLQELSKIYEEQCNSGVEKEVTLSQAIMSLTEVKMDLKRSSHDKRQLEKQVEKLQFEKEKLQTLVTDAKTALKQAAGEKTSIMNYFNLVEETFQTSSNMEATEKIHIKDEELVGDTGSGLKAAKRAVDTFVQAQSNAVARINSLESQIASYRLHISSLKRELHNACHREGENLELYDLPTKDSTPYYQNTLSNAGDTFYEPTLDNGNEFQPLQGEVIDKISMDKCSLSSRSFCTPPARNVACDVSNTLPAI